MIVKLIPLNARICIVEVDGESWARVSCKTARTLGLEKVQEMDTPKLDDLMDSLLVPSAVNAATSWIAKKEMSTKQVGDGLYKRGFARVVIDKALERLRNYGYLNDRRFVRSLIDLRENTRPYGRIRLAADLRAKGITGDVATEALREFDEEKAATLALAMGRRRGLEGQKLYNFLYRRGFGSDVIRTVMGAGDPWNE